MQRFVLRILVATLVLPTLMMAEPLPASAAETEYPNLKTLPPTDLRFDSAVIGGATHQVLRFSNVVWNGGEGELDLHGVSSFVSKTTKVYQRIYDTGGGYVSRNVGEFVFHPEHDHFHFEGFSDFELWTQAGWDAWLASGRTQGRPYKVSAKNTSCVMDTYMVQRLPDTPNNPAYGSVCGTTKQGLSVGWGDLYAYYLYGQWIDLGANRLANNTYVLRSVADPDNRLYESSTKSATSRESATVNEAITYFQVTNGAISVDRGAPTVSLPSTSVLPNATLNTSAIPVTVKWTGHDTISGVARYELQRSVNGGAYGGVRLPTPAATSVTPPSYPDRTYQYRVRGIDRGGNVSAWKVGTPFHLSATPEDSGVTYAGSWKAAAATAAYGGGVRYSSEAASTATRSFTGRQIAFVSDRGASRGIAAIYVDGVRVATIDLYAASGQWRRVVYAKSWNTSGTHRISVQVTGTKRDASSSARVDVDAFVVLR
ncbi:MAG: lysyl oxidase family protein [Chloroflexota bacterium]|nr:lysyl oxidase family protein [Chloroflexota bacterium]